MSPAEALVVHVHVMGEYATRAALTQMRVSTPLCPRAESDGQQPAGSWKGH